MRKILILIVVVFVFTGCQKGIEVETNVENPTSVSEKEEKVEEIVIEKKVKEIILEKDLEEKDLEEKEDKIEEKSKSLTYEPGEGIIRTSGPLQVINGQLSTAKGDLIQLKGLSTHGLQWFGSLITENLVSRFVNDWKIDIIRGAMYVEEGGYTTDYQNYILMNLEKTIKLATQNGIYVMVDWHVHADQDPMKHIEESKEFFGKIAEKYANYENIIYEICNEPNGDITWEDNIKPYAETIIPIIRAFDEDAVIIVGTPTWSLNFSSSSLLL